MKKYQVMLVGIFLSLSVTAQASLSELKCLVEVVKKGGTVTTLAEGSVLVNAISKSGRFDTFKPGQDGLDSNPYRVTITFNEFEGAYATNVEIYDRLGSANSLFSTITDGEGLNAYIQSIGTYKVLGDSKNLRLYIQCSK